MVGRRVRNEWSWDRFTTPFEIVLDLGCLLNEELSIVGNCRYPLQRNEYLLTRAFLSITD